MPGTEYDASKSMQENVQGWVAALNVRVKQCQERLGSLDKLEKDFTRLQTTIDYLDLQNFKKEFYTFREEVRTAHAVSASKAKVTAAITATVISVTTGVIVALLIKFLS